MARAALQSLDMQPLHRTQIPGIGQHNERGAEDGVSHSNVKIDPERTHLNYNLVDIEDKGTLLERVDQRLKEGRTGKASNRKIQKNAILLLSTVVQVNKEYFDELGEEGTKEFFKTAYDHMCDKWGKDNVLSSSVHMDETSPHIHFEVVPLKDGRLIGGEIRRNEMLAMHTDMHRALKEKGFDIERGTPGATKERIKLKEFHARELAKQEKALEKRLEVFNDTKDATDLVFGVESRAELKKTLDFKREPYIKLSPEDFTALGAAATQAAKLKVENEQLKNRCDNLEKLNQMEKDSNEQAVRETNSYKVERGKFLADIERLKEQVAKLEKKTEDLAIPGVYEFIHHAKNEQKRIRLAKERSEFIQKNPNLYVYENLAAKGLSDKEIALDMSQNFGRKSIVAAIMIKSKDAPDESWKASQYANGIVNDLDKSHNDIKKGKVRFPGSGGGLDITGNSRRLPNMTDNLVRGFVNGRGISLKADLFREDDRQDYIKRLSEGVDMDFN